MKFVLNPTVDYQLRLGWRWHNGWWQETAAPTTKTYEFLTGFHDCFAQIFYDSVRQTFGCTWLETEFILHSTSFATSVSQMFALISAFYFLLVTVNWQTNRIQTWTLAQASKRLPSLSHLHLDFFLFFSKTKVCIRPSLESNFKFPLKKRILTVCIEATQCVALTDCSHLHTFCISLSFKMNQFVIVSSVSTHFSIAFFHLALLLLYARTCVCLTSCKP